MKPIIIITPNKNLSTNEGEWSRLIWNVSDLHQSDGFTLSLLFLSNGSDANEGIHLDFLS